MSVLEQQCAEYAENWSALREARAAVDASRGALWRILAPILSRHEKEIGGLFEEADCIDDYKCRFGNAYGQSLSYFSVGPRDIEIGIGYRFRCEVEESVFRLPKRYLNGDVDLLLQQDAAHYRIALARLKRRREAREAAQAREQHRREFARLKALLKDEPEACA